MMRGNCPKCGAMIQVVKTLVVGDTRVRHTGCRGCGYRPEANKEFVPIRYAPRQRSR